jgi:ABC-2 type transport system permease protein
MIRLLKIDFKKLRHYRSFWVLIILFFATMGLVTSSGMEFLKWLNSKGADFDEVDILRVPLYHFPDIWQNLTYVSTYFQLVLAIVVIISLTNEFSYKTIRQNIIDGFDRKDFLASKVLMIFVITVASTLFVFLIGIITGSIYTPESEMRHMFTGIQFIPGYFLTTFAYLMLVMLFAIWIKRAGLAIGLVLIYPALEYAFGASLPDSMDPIIPYLPMHAINAIIKVPFQRYAFMEIQDYVDPVSALVAVGYIVLFILLAYRNLVKRDFS